MLKKTLKVYCGGKRFFQAKQAKTLFQKMLGIMFASQRFTPLLFEFARETRLNAIHSLFCPRFDAVFLNSRKQVVDVKRVEPFSFWLAPRAPAKYLIELPAGEAARKKLCIGKKLFW